MSLTTRPDKRVRPYLVEHSSPEEAYLRTISRALTDPGATLLDAIYGNTNKRIIEFVNDLAECLQHIEGNADALKSLLNEPRFCALVQKSIDEVRKTQNAEKIELLRNAIISMSTDSSTATDDDLFFDLIIDLTPTEAKLLNFFDQLSGDGTYQSILRKYPNRDYTADGKAQPSPVDEYRLNKISELKIDPEFGIVAVKKLINNGFLIDTNDGAGEYLNGKPCVFHQILNDLGRKILRIIKSPNIRRDRQ